MRKSFAIGGKPIPAEIFADFGEAWMSDKRPIVVTIDAKAAIDSNRYADPIKTNGRWVEQAKPGPGGLNGPETMAYEYRGATASGLLVFLATSESSQQPRSKAVNGRAKRAFRLGKMDSGPTCFPLGRT